MTFARNLVREVEVRVPCGSCDPDSGSCDVSMYLYSINVNVEPEGSSPEPIDQLVQGSSFNSPADYTTS